MSNTKNFIYSHSEAVFTKGPFSSDIIIESFDILDDEISNLYTINLLIHSASINENLEDFLSKFVSFKVNFAYDKVPVRFFSGIITEIKLNAFKNQETPSQFIIVIRPYLWLLTLSNGFRVWNKINSEEVISNVLNLYKKKFDDFKFSFKIFMRDSLIKRINTVQYGDSDFDFICRLMHEDHLNFLIIQNEQGSELIITDNIEDYFNKNKDYEEKIITQIIDGNQNLLSENLSNLHSTGYEHKISLKHNKVAVMHCDFKNIKSDYGKSIKYGETSTNKVFSKWTLLTHHQKSIDPLDPIQAFAIKEMARKNSIHNRLILQCSQPNLLIGKKISLEYNTDSNNSKKIFINYLNKKEFRIMSIQHNYLKKNYTAIKKKEINLNNQETPYRATITVIPIEDKFIKDFNPDKKNIPLATTAFVYGQQNEDTKIESPMMIPVSFFWQPKEKDSETNCSPFIMARLSQVWASQNSGAFFIPSPGDEVLIIFEDDIDSPIIVGSLYNSLNKCPFLIDENDAKKRKMRGFVAGNEENLVLHSKDFTSSFDFSEKELLLNIKENSKLNIDEKSFAINIKENSKLDLTDEGKVTLNSKNTDFDIQERLKINTDSTNVTGQKSIQLNSMRIKK
ncbi:contractile injection system protein, VgrG/Pvc8 family [Fluviispira multicolorata]|uniref:Gp5/Type VI secretion system Vgr protein OB-fold domain-containing protein n=1 Tax=Fluviispira multicolorata TaxID=2654512 RepID=A0A833N215_9BACT|nr:contractile injection system protein, VgrG/Pvc8 family [Fluviispira multicolorata]KAB8031912.1 hypothetical protein GCL57_04510 [Fluviispira multicolorata]